jgi:hypothetical protein
LIVGPSQSFSFVAEDADVCGVGEAGPVRETGVEHARC